MSSLWSKTPWMFKAYGFALIGVVLLIIILKIAHSI